MEYTPTQSHNEADLPQEAPLLADWIEDELGDEQLAQFLREHPEGMELCVNGESVLPRTMFELVKDLSVVNKEEARKLVDRAEDDGMLIEVSGNRVVGNLEDEERQSRALKRIWEGSKVRLSLEEGEQEKTRYELMMIEYANHAIDELRKKYELESFRVPPESVRIVDAFPVMEPHKIGTFTQFSQSSDVRAGLPSLMKFETIIHEMTHFKSYGAIVLNRDKEGRLLEKEYRTGMDIVSRDGKKHYLTGLNEAVTEETTNRILIEVPDDHLVFGQLIRKHREEVALVRELNGQDIDSTRVRPYWLMPMNEKNQDGQRSYVVSYQNERIHMEDMFNKLYDRNPDYFKGRTQEESREELFEMLQKAMFTGNILQFGRLFNKTFGSGKFREYGHLQTTEEQEEFIQNL